MPKILVVDDMAVFREPIAMALRQEGFETVGASDGEEALSSIARDRPDLVLLDVTMPRKDGLQVLRELRTAQATSTLAVIMLTDAADKNLIVEAAKLSISGYLLKSSFHLDELIKRVRQALSGEKETKSAIGKGPVGTAGRSSGASAPTSAASSAPAVATPASVDTSNHEVDVIQSLTPIMRRSEVQEMLDECGELKAMSPTVAQVLKMSQQKNCSIDGISKVIKQDHAISLKILKLANSSVYTRGEPVDSIQKAVMRIGLSQIRQTVMNISVVEKFGGVNEDERINSSQFWEHSIATGLIAAEISRKLNSPEEEIDAAFTMGLLHDIGRMVYVEMFGQKYFEVLDMAEQFQAPVEQVESRLLLINHADAMDRVLHAWRFPKGLINPIAFHHLSVGIIRRMSPRSIKEAAVLALANRLSHALLLGSSGNLAIYPIEECLAALNLDQRLLDEIQEKVPQDTMDIKYTMLSRANTEPWPDLADSLRGRLDAPFRPLFVSYAPEVDALRIFCERLAPPAAGEEQDPPSIGVVHLKHAREANPVATKLRDAEREAEVASPLPLVIFSPKGDLRLEERAMAGRSVQLLPFPTTLGRFVKAVNGLCAAVSV